MVPAASGADPAIPVSGIAGATFLTSDPAPLRQFYGHGAGFAVISDNAEGLRFAVGRDQFLEFVPVAGYLGQRRLQFVTLWTPDLNALGRSLKERGVEKLRIESSPQEPVLEFKDPAGDRIRARQVEVGRDNPAPKDPAPFSDHLQHMGFAVDRDHAQATIAFYRDTLGLPEAVRMNGVDGRLDLIKFRLPDSRREVIELILYDPPLNKWAAGAFDHVNFEVSDIGAAYRSLHRGGIATLPKHLPTVNGEHLWAINLNDPELTRIEILDLTPTAVPIDTVSTAP
jgi:catechol 2,3-dioxygenase-like lactoylglutathione lyase family enzyme